MDKISIRKRIIKERKLADPFLLNKYSNIITDKILNDEFIQTANHIGLYYPIHQEVNTIALIDHLLALGKHVYLPKVDKDTMDFYEIFSFDDLKEGHFHLQEPKSLYKINKQCIDLIFVPLVAYNDKNYRIGYGKGYYDRYLKDYSKPTIGLAYSFQKASFTNDIYDIPLTRIITE